MKTLLITFAFAIGIVEAFSQEFINEGVIKISGIAKDETFGYTKKKAVSVGKVENEYPFLRALRGPNGESIEFIRKGSCCAFKSKRAAFGQGFLDVFEIRVEGSITPVTLYLNAYDLELPLMCPQGFTFVSK